jgi:hypothetical protein
VPVWAWVLVALSLVVAIAWLAMAGRAQKRLRAPAEHALLLDRSGLCLRDGTAERRVVWQDIAAISVDEDRLVVRLDVRGGEPLSIEPRYGGLGVYDLEAALRAALAAGGAPA